jgi:hypothetical protein
MTEPPFELDRDDLPDPPNLPGEVIVKRSIDEAIDAFAEDLFSHAEAAVESHGRFDLAVPPDRSLETVWFRLMLATEYRLFPWEQTYVWLTDPNLAAAVRLQETLIWPAGIPIEHVHPMPERGESAFHERLEQELQGRALDALVLGPDVQAVLGGRMDAKDAVILGAERIAVLAAGHTQSLSGDLSEAMAAAAPRLRWYVAPTAST